MRLVDDGDVLLKKVIQQGQPWVSHDRNQLWLAGRRGRAPHTLSSDVASILAECQSGSPVVPKDGPQRSEEVKAEDEVEAAQVETHTRNGEVLGANAKGNVAGEPFAGKAVAIGDRDTELLITSRRETQATHGRTLQEVVRRPVSRRARKRSPLRVMGSSMELVSWILVTARRETTNELAVAAGSWTAGFVE